jgi:alanyl-tRNA synthetase
LTQVIARERGFDIDQPAYEARMEKAKDQGGFHSGDKAVSDIWHLLRERLGETAFVGYEAEGQEGVVRAIVKGGVEVREARAGEDVQVVFDKTPFYGESGGQLGDTGKVTAHEGKSVAQVSDAQRPVPGLVVHHLKLEQGTLSVGDKAQLAVDGVRRRATRANHSATHLLHKALKTVLGDHVKQAGSVVGPDQLRFDYSHFAAPSPEQLAHVEDLVNEWVRDNAEASTKVMELEEAKKSGAVALFGEKYGDKVRVVSVHPLSTELCGGTHVRRSGDIGLMKILSETSIASGVRRVVALTGAGAFNYLRDAEHELRRAADALKTTPKELVKRIDAFQKRGKELEKKAEEASVRAAIGATSPGGANGSTGDAAGVRDVGGVKVLTCRVDPADAKIFRGLADRYRDQLKSGIIGLGGQTADGKALILVAATKDLVDRGFKAGDLVRELAKEVGGSGGGKPDMAQAGGSDPSRINQALEKLYELVKR